MYKIANSYDYKLSIFLSTLIHSFIVVALYFGTLFDSKNSSKKHESFQIVELVSPNNPEKHIKVVNQGQLVSKIEPRIRTKNNKTIKQKISSNQDSISSEKEVNTKNNEVSQLNNQEVNNNFFEELTSVSQNPYFNKLFFIIDKNKKYPRLAKINKETGQVHVSFSIEKDGKITSIKIEKPCQSALLNEAAFNSINQIQYFDPVPDSFGKDKINLFLKINFLL